MDDVRGKVAFITGGAGGIGLGMARVFARAGMRIFLADVEAAALDRAVVSLRDEEGAEAAGRVTDVTDREDLARAADAVEQAFGGVHVLCNNAGVNAPGPLDQLGYADWDWVLGVNLDGVVNGLVTFLPRIQARGEGGHVVNTASVGGLIGMPNLGIYCASKFAVVGLSESLRADLADKGIGVSVLCPGIVRSGIGQSARNRPARFGGALDAGGGEAGQQPQMGTDPVALGEQVLAAIRADELYICTHPEFRDYVRRRDEAVLASFRGEADPELVAAMEPIVGPIGGDRSA